MRLDYNSSIQATPVYASMFLFIMFALIAAYRFFVYPPQEASIYVTLMSFLIIPMGIQTYYLHKKMYYGKYTLLICASLWLLVSGLGLEADKAYPLLQIMHSITLLFGSILFISLCSLPAKNIKLKKVSYKKLQIDELLLSRPKEIKILCIIMLVISFIITPILRYIHTHTISIGIDIIYALLIYALYAGSSWAKFLLYTLPRYFIGLIIFMLMIDLFQGEGSALSTPEIIILCLYYLVTYQLIYPYFFKQEHIKKWFSDCYQARKYKKQINKS